MSFELREHPDNPDVRIARDLGTGQVHIEHRVTVDESQHQRTIIGVPHPGEYYVTVAVGTTAPTHHMNVTGLMLNRQTAAALRNALDAWLNSEAGQ